VMKREGDIACVIAQAIGNGGHCPPDWYWPEVRVLCDKYASLLIFDDIPSGLGKTGVLFNSELFDVMPDMTVLGKALGGTVMPVAALIADARLDSAPELNLGYFTHEKNPLMARAGLITRDIIKKNRLAEGAKVLGPSLLTRLVELQQRHANVVERVRGRGLALSLDFVTQADVSTNTRSRAEAVFFRCIERRMIVNYPGYGWTLKLSLPLNIEQNDIDLAVNVLNDALADEAS